MITGVGEVAGNKILFLGLSGENVTRLAAGEPIRVPEARLAALGLADGKFTIAISYGKTESDILAELTGLPVGVRFE